MKRKFDFMASVYGDLCKILKFFEQQLNNSDFEEKYFTEKTFNISKQKFVNLLSLLLEDELISGIEIRDFECEEDERFGIILDCPRITIKGLRFLAENSVLSKIYKTAKSVKDIIPL